MQKGFDELHNHDKCMNRCGVPLYLTVHVNDMFPIYEKFVGRNSNPLSEGTNTIYISLLLSTDVRKFYFSGKLVTLLRILSERANSIY